MPNKCREYKAMYLDLAENIYDSNIVSEDIIIGQLNTFAEKGLPVNSYDKPYNVPLLTLAASHNLEKVVDRLLELGADPNLRDNRFNDENSILLYLMNEPLFYSGSIFKKMAERMKNINYKYNDERTVLGICLSRYVYNATMGHDRLVDIYYQFAKILLEAGADNSLDTLWEKKFPDNPEATKAKQKIGSLIVSMTQKEEMQDRMSDSYEYEL
ncbi:hypothetical protein [uncultured Cloacibacillus sp.]|uniref:hypothetical protein n=1 Tax=uncultured Cloacibacillus sp. TaxID=889794 RepID=UPI0026DDB4C1|nr:hypothetical protein [uncultured Cloacibacillus sp.]